MDIQYKPESGNLQIRDNHHRHVIESEKTVTADDETLQINASDYSDEPEIIQQLCNALWAIPETRETTPHNEIFMRTEDGAFIVDGRAIGPDDDSTAETPEVQAALDVFYGPDRDSEYAEINRLAQAEPEPQPAEPMTPERAKNAKKAQIEQDYEAELAPIVSQYDQWQIASWPRQIEQAKAIKGNSAANVPGLRKLAELRGDDVATLADTILAKADAFDLVYFPALAKKKNRLDALEEIDLNAPDAIQQIGAV